MKKKKHVFHCSECGSACEIYKKGKNHRVLICPKCGILATNPLPLLAMAAPYALSAAKKLLSKKSEQSEISQSPRTTQKVISDSLDLPNKNERYVKMALGGK